MSIEGFPTRFGVGSDQPRGIGSAAAKKMYAGVRNSAFLQRVADGQILYSFEINEPEVFTAPIKAEIAMNATDGPLFEYACHEGNYSFANMLAGQRAAEAKRSGK